MNYRTSTNAFCKASTAIEEAERRANHSHKDMAITHDGHCYVVKPRTRVRRSQAIEVVYAPQNLRRQRAWI